MISCCVTGATDASTSSSSNFVNGVTSKNLPEVQSVAPMPEDTMENMRWFRVPGCVLRSKTDRWIEIQLDVYFEMGCLDERRLKMLRNITTYVTLCNFMKIRLFYLKLRDTQYYYIWLVVYFEFFLTGVSQCLCLCSLTEREIRRM